MSKTFPLSSLSALAIAASLGAGPGAQAAPLPTSVGSLDHAVTANTAEVRWRRHWRGGWWGYPAAGLGFGIGYGWGLGWPGYYYGAPYYGPSYYAPPVVYEEPPIYTAPTRVYRAEPPRGANRQCWVDTDSSRGFGYWRPC
jgi:hypothetical protein